jgi:hypothetical protein
MTVSKLSVRVWSVWVVSCANAACGSGSGDASSASDGVISGVESNRPQAPVVGEGALPPMPASAAEEQPAPTLPSDPADDGVVPEPLIDFGPPAGEPGDVVEDVCAAQSAASELRRVFLAFALDVSASMGNNAARFDNKWQPVIQAAEAFFSEPDGAAISASLTFFPGVDELNWCTDAAYATPAVAQTLLPSDAFSAAIAALGRAPGVPWRTSTPTLAAFNGTALALEAVASSSPGSTRAMVLVTDGVPQNCAGGVDDVTVVADAVRASGVKTFVVGVGNPPGLGAGDNLANLDVIAAAGGTERAFIVETGDPARTEADFKAVIDGIRGISVSCNIEIPIPPTGTEFLPEKVNVIYGSGGAGDVALSYDADCTSNAGWRYDDPDDPAVIVLCNDSCDTAQRDASARISIEFGCERLGEPR